MTNAAVVPAIFTMSSTISVIAYRPFHLERAFSMGTTRGGPSVQAHDDRDVPPSLSVGWLPSRSKGWATADCLGKVTVSAPRTFRAGHRRSRSDLALRRPALRYP